MSGSKCSSFQLARERMERLEAWQSASRTRGEVDALQKRLAALIGDASEGLRATFDGEVREAQAWLGGADTPTLAGHSSSSAAPPLNRLRSQLDQSAAAGREHLDRLSVAFTRTADQLGRELTRQLASVEKRLLANQRVLLLWHGQGQCSAWSDTLREARLQIESQHYTAVPSVLASLDHELAERAQVAAAKEDKHQKRLVVYDGLLKVCVDLGFLILDANGKEVTNPLSLAPEFERLDDRGSRIVLRADSLDRGKIDFALSLDEITGLSNAGEATDGLSGQQPDTACSLGMDYKKLSEQLAERFGVKTHFRMADGREVPILKRKGEKEEPNYSSAQADGPS